MKRVPSELVRSVQQRISFAEKGLELGLSSKELEERLLKGVSGQFTSAEAKDTVALNAKSLLDLGPDFPRFAGRILLSYIYEETLPWRIDDGFAKLKQAHEARLPQYIGEAVKLGRLDRDLLRFDLERLASVIDPFADFQFDFLGLQTLYDRYLTHQFVDGRKRRLEAPQIFWMRVAMGLAGKEVDPQERCIEFYEIFRTRRACSSSPTLFNSGTTHPQLSSCYILYCGDSIEEIAETWSRFAHLSKWAGGLGCSWTAVRATGALIQGTNGQSSGVIPFLKVSNDIAVAVNQGGKRPGALCSYLELWHLDVEEFLELRQETGDHRRRTHNMNTALWIPDLFMKRLRLISEGQLPKDTAWTLFHSNEVRDLHDLVGRSFEARYLVYERQVSEGKLFGRKIRVLALWKKMLEMLFETGHPWMAWKDPCNIRSPQDHCGVVHSSNLCTEITLNTNPEEVAVCNLASVNLAEHVDAERRINFAKLRDTVRTVMRMLDNVIDINFYPIEPARRTNLNHRPVGLGVMGLQDALYVLRVPFDSPEAVEVNDQIFEALAYFAYEASSDLAAERGRYRSYPGSKWARGILPLETLQHLEEERGLPVLVARNSRLDWDALRQKIMNQGMRNSNCLAIAPTATISNIFGTTPCVEPTYKHIHTKSNLSGEFIRTNRSLIAELVQLGLWDPDLLAELKYFDGSIQPIERVPPEVKRLYKTAFELDPTWIIQCAAARQKWIDQAQSTNLFLAENDARKASAVYREAWARGLKTTYYLRTLNKSGIDSAIREKIVKSGRAACSLEPEQNGQSCESCQ